MHTALKRIYRVSLTVAVACGVVAFGLAQTNRPDILWMDSSTYTPIDLAISPTNDLIATAGGGYTFRLWRLQDGSFVRSFPRLPWSDIPTGVAFSPDGTLLATAWYNGTVQLWNVADGSLVRTLRLEPDSYIAPYQRVVFSRDGSLLAASGTGGYTVVPNVTVWRVATGEQLMNFNIEQPPDHLSIKELQISPDGTLIAVATDIGLVCLYRIPTGELVRTISAHPYHTFSVDFTPDSAFLLTSGNDGVIRLWRVADGSLQRVVASGRFARLSPDGALVAVTTRGGHTEIRRFEDGALLATIPTGGRPVFSPDGSLLTFASRMLGSLGGSVQVWRVPEGTLAYELPWLEPRMFAYSSDGTKLAVVQGMRSWDRDRGIVLRNAVDGSLIRTLELSRENQEKVRWMQFVPNHDLIVILVQGWSVAEQRHYTQLRVLRTSDGTVVRMLEDVRPMGFSADGALMMVVRRAASGDVVQLQRMSDGTIVREMPMSSGELVDAAALSPDARLIAMQVRRPTGPHTWQTSLQVRRVRSNTVVFALENAGTHIRLQFSADGTRLAAFGDTTRIWNTSDFTLLRTFQTPGGAHTEVAAMSADGRLVAIYTGAHEYAIRLWRVDDGQLLRTYTNEVHSSPRQIGFSPTGRQLAYLRWDDTLVVARNPFVVEGDLNGDGCVNNADLLLVLFNFGNAGGTGDANGDGIVNNADLLTVLFRFGQGC